jgi:hypothetical protein
MTGSKAYRKKEHLRTSGWRGWQNRRVRPARAGNGGLTPCDGRGKLDRRAQLPLLRTPQPGPRGVAPFGTLFAEAGLLGDRNGTFSVLLPLLGRFQPRTRNTYPHAANASPIDQCEPRVSASPLPQATFSEIKIQFCIPSLTLSVGDTLWKRHI